MMRNFQDSVGIKSDKMYPKRIEKGIAVNASKNNALNLKQRYSR